MNRAVRSNHARHHKKGGAAYDRPPLLHAYLPNQPITLPVVNVKLRENAVPFTVPVSDTE